MTKRVTVSLPDEIASYLDNADNASAAVADALRAQMNRAAVTEAMLRAAGFAVSEAGQRASTAPRPLNSEQQEEIARRRELLLSGEWPADSAA